MSRGKKLLVLDDRRRELETCGYCPKLCRAACPVSEAEASEALTPWGKMTLTWYQARGDLEAEGDLARLAWGCTGCLKCREHCAHRNPVVPTLEEARAVARTRGLAPRGSEAALRAFGRRRAEARRAEGSEAEARSRSAVLLVGCGYPRGGREAEDARRVVEALAGPTAVARGCCGLVARLAGDVEAAQTERQELVDEVAGRQLVVADAGCALELRSEGALTLVELGARSLERLRPIARAPGPVRYHDACRLGRGLGLYAEPRRVLEKALGAPPAEFERREEAAACSGAGGLLPFTFRRAARAIAQSRLDEHARLGGGTIVTACSASLVWFRAQGAEALDLATVMARSLEGD